MSESKKDTKNTSVEKAKQKFLSERKKDPKAFDKKYGGKQPRFQ